MNTRRKDQKRISRYKQEEYLKSEDIEMGGLGKNMLLLVEGETEEAYFERLKQNPWVTNSLSSVMVKKVGDMGAILKEIDKENQEERLRWIVGDNDKQNAFILEENNRPFFKDLNDEQLPTEICNKLESAYNHDQHAYFLSIHDYLQWLKEGLGADAAIEYWDKIQFLTPHKNWELEKFDKKYNTNTYKTSVKLAYSCIAFEFWLILHFEQNQTPFLWVDKVKDAEIDVIEYLSSHLLTQEYQKGGIGYNAYNCLYDDFNKQIQTRDDEWRVLIRIFTAYRNTKWLQDQMLPTLIRQSKKWYEVNPYVLGIDELIAELLNIKNLGEVIDYFDLTIQFGFDVQNTKLSIQIAVNSGDAFEIDHKCQNFFEIRDERNHSFKPNIENSILFPNENIPVMLQYNIPQPVEGHLVLIFNDPRQKVKSSQLFVLLN